MIKIFEKLLNLIYVQPCYSCGSTKEDVLLCSQCKKKLKYYPPGTARMLSGCSIYAACVYEGVIKNLIHLLKYKKKKRIAKIFAEILNDELGKNALNSRYVIIPVPVHKNRRKERGYNHTEVIALELSKLTGLDVVNDFIIRVKDTQKQYGLKLKERQKNLKDAFKINPDSAGIPSKTDKILILDDIVSTGTTLNEIINVLKNAGYEDITGLSVAMPEVDT